MCRGLQPSGKIRQDRSTHKSSTLHALPGPMLLSFPQISMLEFVAIGGVLLLQAREREREEGKVDRRRSELEARLSTGPTRFKGKRVGRNRRVDPRVCVDSTCQDGKKYEGWGRGGKSRGKER